MTLYEILITCHTGFPFYKWENPNKPNSEVNIVKYTKMPIEASSESHKDFELECGYMAAMSLSARGQGMEVTGIKKKPISNGHDDGENGDIDVIFNLTVDTYMNEHNLWNRIDNAVKKIIFTEDRKLLSDKKLEDWEKKKLQDTFTDINARNQFINKAFDIGEVLRKTLKAVKGEETKLYEYGILGVGILSSSYNILFYKGIKTFLGLSDEEIDYPGKIPDDEKELIEILSKTEVPMNIEGGESKFAYPYEQNIQFIIHNTDIGPEVLGLKEPFHIIVGVRVGFPSKETIDDIIRAIMPILVD